jgi:pimeloyl-ACP methyl ester carboxylesterase
VTSSQEKSTIVRTKKAKDTKSAKTRDALERQGARLRRLFRVLERVAPSVGARVAWNMWSVPTRPNAQAVARSREGGMGEVRTLRIELPDWTGRRSTTRGGEPKPPQSVDITVELLGPQDGPLVYLLHGWGGWRGQLAPIGRRLAASGYRVVLIDAPNHGDSGPGALGPRHSLLPDFSLTLAAVIRELGPAYAVVGHSLGAACSALVLIDGVPAEKAAFIASPTDPVAFTRFLAGMLGFGERIRARMVRLGERRTGIELASFILPTRLTGRADLPRALVVHDADDPAVPIASSRTLAAAWPDARFVETTGLGHNKILRDEAVIAAVVEFIDDDTDANRVRRGRDVSGATVAG